MFIQIQNECRDHVGQEEDKLRKGLQQALTQESSLYRDQLHQTVKRHACQEEHADELSTQELAQLRMVVAEQEDAMMRLQVDSTHALSRQREDQAHKRRALFHDLDSAIRDKDETVYALQRELTKHKEHTFLELEAARLEAERLVDRSRRVFADGPSSQLHATPVEKKTMVSGSCCPESNPLSRTFSWCFCRQSECASAEQR